MALVVKSGGVVTKITGLSLRGRLSAQHSQNWFWACGGAPLTSPAREAVTGRDWWDKHVCCGLALPPGCHQASRITVSGGDSWTVASLTSLTSQERRQWWQDLPSISTEIPPSPLHRIPWSPMFGSPALGRRRRTLAPVSWTSTRWLTRWRRT